jgi:hypothetical protein
LFPRLGGVTTGAGPGAGVGEATLGVDGVEGVLGVDGELGVEGSLGVEGALGSFGVVTGGSAIRDTGLVVSMSTLVGNLLWAFRLKFPSLSVGIEAETGQVPLLATVPEARETSGVDNFRSTAAPGFNPAQVSVTSLLVRTPPWSVVLIIIFPMYSFPAL